MGLRKHEERVASGLPEIMEERALGGNGMGDVSEFGEDGDTRVPCQVCGRKFAMDRIGKHQAICQKISAKDKVRNSAVVNRIEDKAVAGKPAPAQQNNWRERRDDFRNTVR